jgi:uncharacterized protein YfiM (DUF2279 family)
VIAGLALAFQLAAPRDHWFGADKLKHFFVAAFTQTVTYSALQAARMRHDQALAGAWAVTAAASVAKELYDSRTSGLFSFRDLVWDAAGAGAATVLINRSVRREQPMDEPTSREDRLLSPLASSSILRAAVPPASAPSR